MGKYRNESIRLKNWDYGRKGAYFITICTQNRTHYFGEIEYGKMQVTPAGAIAHVLWQEIKHHSKNIELGEFVVMPNHIHGILIIDGNIGNDDGIGGDFIGRDDNCRDVACNVPTDMDDNGGDDIGGDDIGGDDFNHKNEKMAAISPKYNTFSTIIRSYKSAVSKYCNRLDLELEWQSRFYDHVIRDDAAFHRISNYIKNNPANWKEDALS